MIQDTPKQKIEMHVRIFQQVKDLFQIEDMRGAELLASMGRVMHLVTILDFQRFEQLDLSMPRWRVMLHLFMAERMGKSCGLTPTELSHFNEVSKNTVSALLRGLEEQGYIVRELDPKDLRIFRIHLSDAGRELMMRTTPQRIEAINQILDGLTGEEADQLTRLLNKLRLSMEEQVGNSREGEGRRLT